MTATRKPVGEGVCPVCSGLKKLTLDGLMARHASGRKNCWPPPICGGAGKTPVTPPESS
jgi:hypothetical protein